MIIIAYQGLYKIKITIQPVFRIIPTKTDRTTNSIKNSQACLILTEQIKIWLLVFVKAELEIVVNLV